MKKYELIVYKVVDALKIGNNTSVFIKNKGEKLKNGIFIWGDDLKKYKVLYIGMTNNKAKVDETNIIIEGSFESENIFFIDKEITISGKKVQVPPSIEEIIEYLYISDETEVYGYYTGLKLLNMYSGTTQVPAEKLIISNKVRGAQSINCDKSRFLIKESPVEITKDNYIELQRRELEEIAIKYSEISVEEVLKKFNKSNYGICIDDSALWEMKRLAEKYKEKYGVDIDVSAGLTIKRITQEKMVKCMELMIEENISLLDAYNRLF